MPIYKDPEYFVPNVDVMFAKTPEGQTLALYDGIYRCADCGHEKVMRESEKFFPCDRCVAPGPTWQLVCAPGPL